PSALPAREGPSHVAPERQRRRGARRRARRLHRGVFAGSRRRHPEEGRRRRRRRGLRGSRSMPDERQTLSAEDAIIDARRAKAEVMRARGENPFANDTVPRLGGHTGDIAQVAAGRYDESRVRALVGDEVFHVRGRVIALRSTGGLSFIRLRDRTGEIQLLVSEAALGADYARLAEFDVGDVLEAEGELTASKRGELSITPRRVRLLTKALRPLPEKWHGLTDVEIRYRQRYVAP